MKRTDVYATGTRKPSAASEHRLTAGGAVPGAERKQPASVAPAVTPTAWNRYIDSRLRQFGTR